MVFQWGSVWEDLENLENLENTWFFNGVVSGKIWNTWKTWKAQRFSTVSVWENLENLENLENTTFFNGPCLGEPGQPGKHSVFEE